MGHMIDIKESYRDLRKRLDRFPVGAPENEAIYEILKIIFTEEEAKIASLLPMKPVTAEQVAKITKNNKLDVEKILDQMAGKGAIVDFIKDGVTYYILAPTVIGFFELSLMRVRDDIPQKKLAEYLHEYMYNWDLFAKEALLAQTRLGRVLVHENALSEEDYCEILSFDKASQIIQNSNLIGVSLCYCRHKQSHLNLACNNPMDVCTSLGMAADYVIRKGLGRRIDKKEGLEILYKTRELGLIHIGDNVKKNLSYICHCCSCCCGQIHGITKFGIKNAIVTSNYIAKIDPDNCTGCQKCVKKCPIQAISMVEIQDGKKKKAKIDESLCLGCGVCHSACNFKALHIIKRKERIITPETTLERIVNMALETGKLQHLLFDDFSRISHRILNIAFGIFLNLPPTKKILLKEQIKSKFVHTLIDTFKRSDKIGILEKV